MTGQIPATLLIDTNILVHYVRQSDLYKSVETAYRISSSGHHHLISIVTHREILSLAWQFGWGSARKAEAEQFLSRCVTIGTDHPGVVEAYAELDAFSLRVGRPIGDNDLWIAASTRVTGTLLITTDKDFDHLSPAFIDRVWIDPNTLKKPFP